MIASHHIFSLNAIMMIKFLIVVAIFGGTVLSQDLYCQDEEGNTVEWFIAYKVPRNGNRGPLNSGSNYTYVLGKQIKANPNAANSEENSTEGGDSGNSTKSDGYWSISENGIPIESKRSIIGRTLAPLFAFPGDYSYVLYNDEPPRGRRDDKKGFSKGVLALNKERGLWMTHSVPRFPSLVDQCYEYPRSGEGDIFMCMSLKTDEIKKVVKQLNFIRPNVYDSFVQPAVKEKIPDIRRLQNNDNIYQTSYGGQQGKGMEDITAESQKLKTFARMTSQSQTGDFYAGYLDRHLQKNLFVKTQSSPIQATCNGEYQSVNVKKVTLNFDPTAIPVYMFATGPWPDYNDRSKWVVTTEGETVCITDLDRRNEHARRGGLAVCIDDSKVYNTFKKSATELQQCNQRSLKM